jgi:predicted  nucleic acid-binding Zn-ribbon protein
VTWLPYLSPLASLIGVLLPGAWAVSKGWAHLNERVQGFGGSLDDLKQQVEELQTALRDASQEVSAQMSMLGERMVRTEERVRSLDRACANNHRLKGYDD